MEATVCRLEAIIQSSATSDKSSSTQITVDRILKKLPTMSAAAKGKDKVLTKTVGASYLNARILNLLLSLGTNSPREIILGLLGKRSV